MNGLVRFVKGTVCRFSEKIVLDCLPLHVSDLKGSEEKPHEDQRGKTTDVQFCRS